MERTIPSSSLPFTLWEGTIRTPRQFRARVVLTSPFHLGVEVCGKSLMDETVWLKPGDLETENAILKAALLRGVVVEPVSAQEIPTAEQLLPDQYMSP
jgi:hypothetical protein